MKALILRCLRLGALIFGVLAKIEFHLWADNHRKFQLCRKIYFYLSGVSLAGKVYCGPDIYIRAFGKVTLGQRCALGFSTRLWNYDLIEIGDDFMAADGLVINTGTHDVNTMKSSTGAVKIGDRCWCGLNVTILAGVAIGHDVVIAAGSVVKDNVPDNVIVGGVPARVIRGIERDLSKFNRSDWGAQ